LPYHFYDAVTLKTSAKSAQAIIVSSKFEYEDALEFGIEKERIHIIPMGIDVEEFEKKTKVSEELQILFVGRIARVRRIELLLQAVSRLNFPFHLTLVGGEEKTSSVTRMGYLNELKQLTKQLNLGNKVTFVGKKPSQDLKTFYQSADIFVYPSLYENFAQPLLEAAAYGLPLVSTSVGIARDIIIEGETGYQISGKPEEIKERIESLKDSELRLQMGERIQNEVKNRYDWGNIMDQYMSLYCSL
jgi:glycosyltransferase involved in cell wall biosynthesis